MKTILILVPAVFATMFTLVSLSYLEVAVYAYLINPGHPEAFYEAHAVVTAPWVSGITGLFVFYAAARWLLSSHLSTNIVAFGYPTAYLLIDIMIVAAIATVDWSSFIWVTAAANAPKFVGAYFGVQHAGQNTAVKFESENAHTGE